MNAIRKPVYCLLSTLLCLGTAQAAAENYAATLMEVDGTVLVNQGKDYQMAQSGMKLAPNARVLTKDKARAVVSSKQGCATRLGANSLFVVKASDPCHGGAATVQNLGPARTVATGETGGGAAANGSGGLSSTQLTLIGAGAVALVTGGVMGGLAASGGLDADSDTSSTANIATATAASKAVTAAGGSPAAANAAFTAVIRGGDAAQVSAAVVAAGGSPRAAQAASSVVLVSATGGVTSPLCAISATTPGCRV